MFRPTFWQVTVDRAHARTHPESRDLIARLLDVIAALTATIRRTGTGPVYANVYSTNFTLEDRITRAAWFVRQHDEVPAETWKRASIKSAANCSACHSRADQGDFDEDNVRIPR